MPLDRRCSSWRSGCGRRMCEGEKAERLELSYLIWLSERSEIKINRRRDGGRAGGMMRIATADDTDSGRSTTVNTSRDTQCARLSATSVHDRRPLLPPRRPLLPPDGQPARRDGQPGHRLEAAFGRTSATHRISADRLGWSLGQRGMGAWESVLSTASAMATTPQGGRRPVGWRTCQVRPRLLAPHPLFQS